MGIEQQIVTRRPWGRSAVLTFVDFCSTLRAGAVRNGIGPSFGRKPAQNRPKLKNNTLVSRCEPNSDIAAAVDGRCKLYVSKEPGSGSIGRIPGYTWEAGVRAPVLDEHNIGLQLTIPWEGRNPTTKMIRHCVRISSAWIPVGGNCFGHVSKLFLAKLERF